MTDTTKGHDAGPQNPVVISPPLRDEIVETAAIRSWFDVSRLGVGWLIKFLDDPNADNDQKMRAAQILIECGVTIR